MTSVAIITPTFGNGIPEEIQVIIAGMLSEYSLDEVPELAEVHISLYPSVVMLNGRTPLEGPIYTVRPKSNMGKLLCLGESLIIIYSPDGVPTIKELYTSKKDKIESTAGT